MTIEYSFEHNGHEILLGHDPYGVSELLEQESDVWKEFGIAFRDNGNGYEPDQVFGDEYLPGEMLDLDNNCDQVWLDYQAADGQLSRALSDFRREYLAANLSGLDSALVDMSDVLEELRDMTESSPQIIAKKTENTTIWVDLDKFRDHPEQNFDWSTLDGDLSVFESLQRGEAFYIHVIPLEDRENYELATPVFWGHGDPTEEEILAKLEEYGFEV